MRPATRYQKGDKIGGRYLVHRALAGGMGEVYLCLDLKHGIPIALKTFQARYLGHPRVRDYFEREVATWIALENHPHITRCFELNMETVRGLPLMVLEWVFGEVERGSDLRSWLAHGPLEPRLAVQVAIDVCRGLVHAQRKVPGLVHLDLKPENVLMEEGGVAKVTDFGLAKVALEAGPVPSDEMGGSSSRRRLSRAGGTPAYMAAEQWRGEPVDGRADLYALGCVLFEMLTGRLAFDAGSLEGMRALHLSETVPALAGLGELGQLLNPILARCLAKEREQRYPEATALLAELERVFRQRWGQEPRILPEGAQFSAGDYNNRGHTNHALGRHEEALADFGQALRLDPNDCKVYCNRGSTYLALGRHEEALADFTKAIGLDPNIALIYYNRGVAHLTAGRHEEALADFTQSIRLDPAYVNAYMNRGVTYAELGRHGEALVDYGQAVRLDPSYPHAYLNRGNACAALGRHQEALAHYGQAIRLDPSLAKAYNSRGKTYFALGRHEEALADHDQAVRLDPNDANAYFYCGATCAALGRHEEALAHYDQAVRLDPSFAVAYNNIGALHIRRGNLGEALAAFDRAAQLGAPLGEQNAARARKEQGQLADYDQAIRRDPNDANAYNNRANIYDKMGRHEEALADFTQAIRLDPNRSETYYNRGNIYLALGRHEEALADFTQAIRLDPRFVKAYNCRGYACAALGRHEGALADFTQAIRLDPSFARAYCNIGSLHARRGDLRQALPAFLRAAQLGYPAAAEYASRARAISFLADEPVASSAKQAFEEADSLEAMRSAAEQAPLLLQPQFLAAVELAGAQVPPDLRPAFQQRLTWLLQVAAEKE
jgi:tetratricopeptide (TPR) repeat protein